MPTPYAATSAGVPAGRPPVSINVTLGTDPHSAALFNDPYKKLADYLQALFERMALLDDGPGLTPGGRLTLVSGEPVPAADVLGAGTIYYTPYRHNVIELHDGTRWVRHTFNETAQLTSDATKSPGAATTDKNYDMFAWLDGATFRVTRGPAWTSDTARGAGAGTTELELLDGRHVNKFAITNGPAAGRGLYVGSIRTNTGAATVSDGGEVLQVWSLHNQVETTIQRVDTTDSWFYGTPAYREAGGVANRVRYLQGLAGNPVTAQVVAHVEGAALVSAAVGVGVDSATVNSAQLRERLTLTTANQVLPLHAHYSGRPGIGWHALVWLEYSGGTNFYGDNNDITMQSGISARLLR